MNRIINKAPEYVAIDGIKYKLNTDFRGCLKIIMAFEDNDLTQQEKVSVLLYNLYANEDGEMPETLIDYNKAITLGIKFLDCGEEMLTEKNTVKQRLYSFKKDSKYIIPAMLTKTNGVDLDTIESMHWWTFISHFMEIGESKFSRICYLRYKLKKGLSKEERKECDEFGWDTINLEDNVLKHDDIERYING